MAKTASKCVYNSEKRSQPTGKYPSHRADDHQSGQRSRGPDPVETPTTTLYHSPSDGVFAGVLPPAQLDRIPSIFPEATWAVTNEPAALQHAFGADRVPHRELVPVRRNQFGQRVSPDTSPSIFTTPSFFLPTTPPELRIPLSFLGEERLQVQFSEAAATDLDMKSCVLE
jgi:hypothetical protein